MFIYIIAALLGAIISIVWAWYIQVVADSKPLASAVSDVLLLILTFAQYQLWAWQNNDWRVFVAVIVGTIPGTYSYIRWKNVQRRRNLVILSGVSGERTATPCAD